MTQPSSGHIYLSLKDKNAQINAIIWRSDAQSLKFEPTNGLEVVCRGSVDTYPQRGTYQLIIRQIQPKGIGSLELALRQLRQKLSNEGLFDAERKKQLPRFPKHIAVVTSPTGAAIRDFLQVLVRRWNKIRVTVVPAKVQGAGSAEEVAEAIRLCDEMSETPDAIVVTRGGGSMEDLWSFNSEVVVRAIADSTIPVISGVGHEIDVTLADLVADVRALTPSEAAERLVPKLSDVTGWLESTHQRMALSLTGSIRHARQQLDALASRTVITQPLDRIRQSAMEVDFLESRMHRAISQRINGLDQELKQMAARMDAINPLSVLARGYSLTTDSSGNLLRSCNAAKPGDKITTRVADGVLTSVVDNVTFEKPETKLD